MGRVMYSEIEAEPVDWWCLRKRGSTHERKDRKWSDNGISEIGILEVV